MPLNPISNFRLAEGEALVQQMRAMIAANLALYEDGATCKATATDRMASYNTLKVGASELVVRATDVALRICGIQGYMEEGEFYLSRHIRDAHSAMVMVNDNRILGPLQRGVGCAHHAPLFWREGTFGQIAITAFSGNSSQWQAGTWLASERWDLLSNQIGGGLSGGVCRRLCPVLVRSVVHLFALRLHGAEQRFHIKTGHFGSGQAVANTGITS